MKRCPFIGNIGRFAPDQHGRHICPKCGADAKVTKLGQLYHHDKPSSSPSPQPTRS